MSDVLPIDRKWVTAKAIALVAEYRNCKPSETKEVMQDFVDYMQAALADASSHAGKLTDDEINAVWDSLPFDVRVGSFRAGNVAFARALFERATQPRFPETFCSSCGKALGPGNEGVSSCKDHT